MESLRTQPRAFRLIGGCLLGLRPWAIGFGGVALLLLLIEFVSAAFLPKRSDRFLREDHVGEKAVWVDNLFFPYRFTIAQAVRSPPPTVVPQVPAPNTLRVCLLGDAAAEGFPDASFGLGRQLELLLRNRYPGQPVEVVHMAFAGGNSHILREVARDLQRLQPQAVVILTGNEEIAGPYGPASSLGGFHHSSKVARSLVLFSRTRLSRLLAAAVNFFAPAIADEHAWRSKEPISLLGRMPPDDPRLRGAYRSFRNNLKSILCQAQAASPAVIACTVPVNLRDNAPFMTHLLDDETTAQEVRELLRAGATASAAGNTAEAARQTAAAIRRDPHHAEALYRAAHFALADNQSAEAAALFLRARDSDSLRLRADSQINEIIRTCAAESNVSLLDAEALFAIRSPQGIPGNELFLDHIHFTQAGTYLMAKSILDRLEFLRAFDVEPTGAVLKAAEVAADMLYSPWGASTQLDAAIEQQLRPPFRRQISNSETLARLTAAKATLEASATARSHSQTLAIFARHRTARPNDPWLALRITDGLLQASAFAAAEKSAADALSVWPHRFEVRSKLALARALQEQPTAEGLELLRSSDTDTGYFDVVQAIEIGKALIQKKRPTDAKPWLEYALSRDSWNSTATIELAEALYRMDDGIAAIETLQAAIEQNPNNPLLWEEIAVQYCLQGDWKVATDCFRKSEAIAPYRYDRLLKWSHAMVRLRQYRRALSPIQLYLAALPDDPEAISLLAHIREHLPAQSEATEDPSPKKKNELKFPWETK